jgi:hypothetical protein
MLQSALYEIRTSAKKVTPSVEVHPSQQLTSTSCRTGAVSGMDQVTQCLPWRAQSYQLNYSFLCYLHCRAASKAESNCSGEVLGYFIQRAIEVTPRGGEAVSTAVVLKCTIL